MPRSSCWAMPRPRTCRSAHAVAHVLEMQGRRSEGIQWLTKLAPNWEGSHNLQHHLWWHCALIKLEYGDHAGALELYDTRFRNLAKILIAKAVRNHLGPPTEIEDAVLINTHVVRVEVRPDQLVIELAGTGPAKSRRTQKHRNVIEVPWRKTPSTRRREVLVPESGPLKEARPIRSESRALLVALLADRTHDRSPVQYRKHRRPRGLQRPKNQQDNLACLSRARSR